MAITFGPTKWHPSYQEFVIQTASLGSAVLGGLMICRNGGTAWIIAPASTEVSRNWYSLNDAVTTANANAACGDWFVPTIGPLINPGYECRTYWDSYSSTAYWSSSETTGSVASVFLFQAAIASNGYNKANVHCVRAMRCVAY